MASGDTCWVIDYEEDKTTWELFRWFSFFFICVFLVFIQPRATANVIVGYDLRVGASELPLLAKLSDSLVLIGYLEGVALEVWANLNLGAFKLFLVSLSRLEGSS